MSLKLVFERNTVQQRSKHDFLNIVKYVKTLKLKKKILINLIDTYYVL